MYVSQTEIERIKREVSIEQFLVNPKRQGGFLVARCPLPNHDDRTPSFRYNLDGGWWRCMGCGRGGSDVLKFACAYWGFSWPRDFPLVLERLGAHPDEPGSVRYRPPAIREMQSCSEVWPRLPAGAAIDTYRVAAELWAANLWHPINRDALTYLRGRGLPDTLIRAERIGVATDTLAAQLDERGLSLEIARDLGLLRRDNHETFAGRITFVEWRLVEGGWAPVWATARTYGASPAWDDARKYLNVRGDRVVCGLGQVGRAGEVIVVEGPFDRLAIRSFGDAAVCLGSNQPSAGMVAELRALARTCRLILLADADRAGRKGRLRTLAALDLPPAAEIYLADLPRGIPDPGALAEGCDGAAIYRAVKARARRVDPVHFKRLATACHKACQRQKAAPRARLYGLSMGPISPEIDVKGGRPTIVTRPL